MKNMIWAVAVLALAVSLSACEKKGAFEQMGSDADKAMNDAGKKLDEMTK